MGDSISDKLQRAMTLHRSGSMMAAELAYLDILRENPNHPDANHNLGMLRVQQGRFIDALALLNIPIVAEPSNRQYWLSYINTLIDAQELSLAREILELAGQYGISGESFEALRKRLYPLAMKGDNGPSTEQIDHLINLFSGHDEAAIESAASRLVIDFPEHFFGWKVLGTLYTKQSRHTEAEQALRQAITFAPDEAEAHNTLGNLYMNMGRLEEAEACFHKAVILFPEYAEAYNNLGNVQGAQRNFNGAMDSFAKALKINPDYAQVHFNLGTLLYDAGQEFSAISSLQRAIVINPEFAQAHYNLAGIMMALKEFQPAIASYKKAIEVDPNYADAYYNMAMAYKDYGQLDNAIACFRQAVSVKENFSAAYNNLGISLHQMGHLQESAESYRRAIEIEPHSAVFYNNLGLVLHDFEQADAVIECYRHAIEINPDYAEAYNNLGTTLYELGQYEEAIECYSRTLELDPKMAQGYCNFGTVLRDMGRIDEAVEQYLKAIELQPEFETAYNALFFCINYHPTLSAENIYSYYQNYEQKFGRPLRISWKKHRNDMSPDRRLRVGYMAATLHRHSCRHFLQPLLEHHDKDSVEVFIYAQLSKEDDLTEIYQSYADHWIPIRGLGDALLSERIIEDQIDVLIDIPGHTAGNRLKVFARKPAPISLHWLDFGYTTGLKAIDYYLTDKQTIPEGSEHLFSEMPWRLPVPAYAYRPAEGMGEVNALPAKSRGYVTFGTLTRAVRINHRTIRVWSEILKAVPGSHLVINSSNFNSQELSEMLIEQFSVCGVHRDCLEIGLTSPPWDVLRGMDISLDCFPHNSGTTLFETLYMGIPFVTLADRPSVGRMGASILHGIGHPEWVAETEEGYIEKAVFLAADLERLSVLRSGLREEMKKSPLMDEVGFTRAVEDAYRQMWKRWCENFRN